MSTSEDYNLTAGELALLDLAFPLDEEDEEKDELDRDAPSGIGAAFSQTFDRAGLYTAQGIESLGYAAKERGYEGLADVLDDYAKESIEENTRQLEEMQKYRTSREDIGIGSLDEITSGIAYYSEALVEQTALIGTGIVGTLAAAKAAPLIGLGVVGTTIAAGTAGAATQVPYFFGSNITRQKETGKETPDEIDYDAAFTASIGQAGLSQLTNMVGLKLLNKFGKPVSDNFFQTVGRQGEGLFSKSGRFGKRVAKGAAFTGGVEGVTEVGQQALERAQAGLDLGSEEAVEEYGQAFVDGLILGGVLGGTAGALGVDASSMIEKQEVNKKLAEKAEGVDTKIEEEIKKEGENQPDWKSQQIKREVLAEEYYKDAEDHYNKEVAAGRDPEEVKAEIAEELDRVLLIQQDRGVAPTRVGPIDEESSIEQKAKVSIGTFIEGLGTDKVDTSRPNLEPEIVPKEVKPQARPAKVDAEAEAMAEEGAKAEAEAEEEAEAGAEALIDDYKDDIAAGRITKEDARKELSDAGLDPNKLDATELETIEGYEQRVQDGEISRKDAEKELQASGIDPKKLFEPRTPKKPEAIQFTDEFIDELVKDFEQRQQQNKEQGIEPDDLTSDALRASLKERQFAEQQRQQQEQEQEQDQQPDGDLPDLKSIRSQILNDIPEGTLDPKVEKVVKAKENQLANERKTILTKVYNVENESEISPEPKPINNFLNVIADDKSTSKDNRELASKLSNRITELETEGAPKVATVVGTDSDAVGGTFLPERGVIVLNRSEQSEGLTHEVVLHEAVHAATTAVVTLGREGRYKDTELGKTIGELQSVQGLITEHIKNKLKPFDKYIKIDKKTRQPYYDQKMLEADNVLTSEEYKALDKTERDILGNSNIFRNEDETLAWSLSSPEAKEYLESIKVPKDSPLSDKGKNKNAWQTFVNWLKKIFNVTPKEENAFERVLDISNRILSEDPKVVAEMGRKFKEVAERQAAAGKPIELKSLRSLFGFLSTKTETKPKTKTQAKTETKPKEKRQYTKRTKVDLKIPAEDALSKRAARKKFTVASERAQDEKIVSTVDLNVKGVDVYFKEQVKGNKKKNRPPRKPEDVQPEVDKLYEEIANPTGKRFRPDETETPRFLTPLDMTKVTKLLNYKERDLLEGDTYDKKSPNSAAWNYFSGYEKPESALRTLAYDLGVGLVAGQKEYSRTKDKDKIEITIMEDVKTGKPRPAFRIGDKKALLDQEGIAASQELGPDFISPWEQAFFEDTGGSNALLFLDWVEENLSKKAAVNLKNMTIAFRKRHEMSIKDSVFDVDDFKAQYDPNFLFVTTDQTAVDSTVTVLEPGTPEFQNVVDSVDWDKIDRKVKDVEVTRKQKIFQAKESVKAVRKGVRRNRNLDLLNIERLEKEQIQADLDAGKITKEEATNRRARAEIEAEGLKVEFRIAQIEDQIKGIVASQTSEKDIVDFVNEQEALGQFPEADQFLPLTIEAATELNRTADVRLIDAINSRKGDDTSKLKVALEYIFNTTTNKAIGRIVKAFYAELNNPIGKEIKLKLTSEDVLDASGLIVASRYDPDPNNKQITMNVNYVNTRALLHELAHALTHGAVKEGKLPAIKDLKKLYEQTKEVLGDAYGTASLEEFIAEAFSNADFRNTLAGINYKGDKLNILQRFTNGVVRIINAITKFFFVEGTKFKTTALAEVDSLLAEIVPPSPDLDINSINTAESVTKLQQEIGAKAKEKEKLVNSPSFKRYILRKFLTASAQVQRYSTYLMSNQSFTDLAESLGLKNTEKIDTFLQKFKGITNRVDKELEVILNTYDKWSKKAGVEGVELFNDVIYSRLFGSTIHQVSPQLTRAEAIQEYGATSEKFKVWEAQRPAWNKLRTIIVDGKNGHDLYKQFNGYYAGKFVQLRQLLTGKIEALVTLQNIGKTEKQIQAKLNKIKQEIVAPLFDKQPLDVYFPLVRGGRYSVGFRLFEDSGVAQLNPTESFVFELHETYDQANQAIEEIQIKVEKARAKSEKGEILTTDEAFFEAVDLDTLNKVPKDINTKEKPKADVDLDIKVVRTVFDEIGKLTKDTEAEREQVNNLEEAISKLFIDLLPETSFAKQLQLRKYIPGYIADSKFALQTKGRAIGIQVERQKVLPEIRALQNSFGADKADFEAKGVSKTARLLANTKQQQEAFKAIREVAYQKVQELIDPANQNAFEEYMNGFASKANAFAFLMTIGFNASSAAVNLSQIPLVVQNKLAGVYGLTKSLYAMRLAFRYLSVSDSGFSLGLENYYNYDPKTDTYKVKTEAFRGYKNDLEKLKPLVTLLRRRGLLTVSAIDQQFAQQERAVVPPRQAGAFDTESTFADYRKKANGDVRTSTLKNISNFSDKLVSLSGVMFSGAEKISRQATLIATYLLEVDRIQAKKSRTKDAKLNDADYEKAVNEAVYVMQETNGASFRESAPPLTRQAWAAMAMMYKTFGLQMYYLQIKQMLTVINSTFRSRKGAKQADIDEMRRQRKAAIYFAMGNTAVGLFLSGVVGNTFYGAVQLVYDSMMEMGFLDDEDESKNYKDFNRYVRELLGNDTLYRGFIAEAFGINAGDRMRLSSLIIQEDKFRRDMSLPERAFNIIGGPAASVAFKMSRAGVSAYDRDYMRAVEQAMPTGFANIIKATGRYRTEGARTRDNQIILDDITNGELAAQLFGFAPMRLVRIQELTGERKYLERTIVKKRSDLTGAYNNAYFNNDMDKLDRITDKIIKFNKQHKRDFPNYQITTGTLKRSTKAQKRIRKKYSHNGVRVDPAFQDFLMNELEREDRERRQE